MISNITKAYLTAGICLMAAMSCRQQENPERSTIPFVKEILADRGGHYRQLIPSGDALSANGHIYLIGTAGTCDHLAGYMASCDLRDNVSGAHMIDGLPDFAGETIVSLSDSTHSDISSAGNTGMRESAVRMVLAALDTIYHITPYDMDGLGRKAAAKVIILQDPALTAYGKFDVDTLFEATSCSIPVLSPMNLMLGKASAEHTPDNIGIICHERYADTRVYETVIEQYCSDKGIKAIPHCTCMALSDSTDALTTFLERYVELGGTEPLDVLIVDDCRIDMQSMEEKLEHIRDLSRPESLQFSKLLDSGFRILEPDSVVAEACFDIMRSKSAFTHRISYPRKQHFHTAPHPGGEDKAIVMIPTADVQDKH